jgi:hypothetical protein
LKRFVSINLRLRKDCTTADSNHVFIFRFMFLVLSIIIYNTLSLVVHIVGSKSLARKDQRSILFPFNDGTKRRSLLTLSDMTKKRSLSSSSIHIVFGNSGVAQLIVPILQPLPPTAEFSLLFQSSDFGDLDILIPEDINVPRVIYHDFHDDQSPDMYQAAKAARSADDNVDYYYAFDDDYARNPYRAWNDDNIHRTHQCRRTSFHRRNPTSCNPFHELGIADHVFNFNFKYLKYVFQLRI